MELYEAQRLKRGDKILNPGGCTYTFEELVENGGVGSNNIIIYSDLHANRFRYWRTVAEMKLPEPTPKFKVGKYKATTGATFMVEYVNDKYAFGSLEGLPNYVAHAHVRNYTKI